MTEVERIIKLGLFTKDFFTEEIICDYKVTAEMKKLWAIQIDLYLEFARVCDKNGLRYFAMFGTALGAVRHNGFIPWDDDIDVVMPREDYMKLCNIYAREFIAPYFLQTPQTDPGYYVSFAKLRNSNTALISMPYKNSKFNQGVQIDIFPLDFCDPLKAEEMHNEINEHIMKCSSFMKKGSENELNEHQLANFNKYQTLTPLDEVNKVHELAMSCKSHDYVGVPCLTLYKSSKLIWPANCFDKIKYHKFENIKVALPSGIDEILTILYGDYMKFPSVDQRGTWHSSCVIDLDHSYKDYILPDGWSKALIN